MDKGLKNKLAQSGKAAEAQSDFAPFSSYLLSFRRNLLEGK